MSEARCQFLEKGYRATTVNAIAKDLGLTSAAVHWYFPTKDDLFAAVLEEVFVAAVERVTSDRETGGDPRAELIGVLVELHPHKGLLREAYERMDTAPALRAAYAHTMDWIDTRLIDAISRRVPEGANVELLAETAHVLMEGLLVSVRRSDRPPGDMIDLLIDPLAAAAAANRQKSTDA